MTKLTEMPNVAFANLLERSASELEDIGGMFNALAALELEESARRIRAMNDELQQPPAADAPVQGAAPITLRPFQAVDWDAYAGCDDEHPEIASIPLGHDLVLDGFAVAVFINSKRGYIDKAFSRTFNSKKTARSFAIWLLDAAVSERDFGIGYLSRLMEQTI